MPTMPKNTLIEHVSDWHVGLTVDRPNRTVRNVALTGLTSKNGYRYTEQALKEAAALYEQKPVFLDHALDKSRPHERSTRDLAGTIVNPRYESGRIRGDIRVLDTESGRTFLALSESDAPGVGMSHVVLAQRAAADGAVERIHDVVSVDAVVFPATTKTFRESVAAEQAELASVVDEEAISAASHPDTDTDHPAEAVNDDNADSAGASQTESQDADLHGQLQQLLSERDELLGQLQSIRQREEAELRQRQLQHEISEAGLPEYAMSEEFRRQLLQAGDESRTALIRERRQLLDAARRQPPRSADRAGVTQPVDVDAAFVSTVRRRA